MGKLIACFALVMVATPSMADDEPRTWHLLERQADGGIAGILHDLTKNECEFAQNRIEGHPATASEKTFAENYRNDAGERWAKWAADHHCDGWGGTSARSYVTSNGMCMRGHDMDGIIQNERSYSPHDVMTAECFQ